MTRLMLVMLGAATLLAACGSGNVFSLEVGTCYQDPGAVDEVSDVETVDCGEAHDYEVFALFDLDDGDYPGQEAVGEAALQGCFLDFEQYVGRDYQSSELDMTWLIPTSDSWGDGDREVVCTLFEFAGGQLTGSMKDSGV